MTRPMRPREPPERWVAVDLHVHESHSSDAPGATVAKYCRVAEERGIDEVGFATHLIISGPDIDHGIAPERIPEYLEEIEAAQRTTGVRLRVGLEVDYFPGEERRLGRLLDEHPLDFVLGSLHYIRGYDIGSRRGSTAFFGGRRIDEALEVYYDGWREAVESGLFDIMAHPDYFRKYLPLTRPSPPAFEEYGTAVLEAIDSLRSYGVGVEVNSSGFRHGLGDCYPTPGFLRAIREAGVETVTVGSDSHSPEGLGVKLDEAVKRLAETGYTHLCVYGGRRNRRVPLSEL
ncbi:MAG: histidinol-phosphatase [Candidatus Bathyarchaeia archaeon]